MDRLWELELRDGTRLDIPPELVEVIKKRWDSGQPIHTRSRGSIPASSIYALRPTARLVSDPKLLEDAARAFREPIYTEDGVVAKWVKKDVTITMWEKHYSKLGYRKLAEDAGIVTMAWRLPAHLIRPEHQELTVQEVREVTNRLDNE